MRSIGIYTAKAVDVEPWDPESIHQGLTGSEEAIIYLAKELAKLNYHVTVFGNPPKDSNHSIENRNPLYLPLEDLGQKKVDIAISWRVPTTAKLLHLLAPKVYLWPHDIYLSKLSEEEIEGFDGVFWLSAWQRNQWVSVNPSFAKFTEIFGNGINPDQFKPIVDRPNPYSCIYASNYGKGLRILLDLWPQVKEKYPKATLDIYYGWKSWGYLNQETEEYLRKKVESLKKLDVHEHGMVGHLELNEAFSKASLWTYPGIEDETFCITALRAQFAGAIPVIILKAALKEVVRTGFACKEKEHYLRTIFYAMQRIPYITMQERIDMGHFILKEFTWEAIAQKWAEYFQLTLRT